MTNSHPTENIHQLDNQRLAAWLSSNMDVRAKLIETEKFAGGQSNPTYLLKVDGAPRFVLRKKPPGTLLPSAHAVEREYRVMTALQETDVPVPKTYALCEDTSVIGTAFFLMDYVAGRNFWDMRLPDVKRDERAAIYDEINRVIAALHQLDPDTLGLNDYGRKGGYFERQITRWTKQYRATETQSIAAMDQLIDWLPKHLPEGLDETSIVHGDYRIDNLIFHKEKPQILAVIDWELSTLGHPLADLAYHLMAWRLSADEFRGLAGTDLSSLGIPSEAQYLAAYVERTQRPAIDPAHWEFAMVFNMFRVACIRQGVLKRALTGNASNDFALSAGRRAEAMATIAWQAASNSKG